MSIRNEKEAMVGNAINDDDQADIVADALTATVRGK